MVVVVPENAENLSIRKIKRIFAREEDHYYWYLKEGDIAKTLYYETQILGLKIARNFVRLSTLFPRNPKTPYLTKRRIYLECDLAYLCSKIGVSYSRMGNHDIEKDAYYFKSDMHKYNVEDLEKKQNRIVYYQKTLELLFTGIYLTILAYNFPYSFIVLEV